MAIIDVIKFEGGNNVLVWKHPKEDFNTSAQLIVHETQEAIVFKDGKASEPYLAGKYTIETENIPGIRRIVNLVTGGITPNHYEVYFINKSYSMDVHWGTASDWIVQDPSLQIPFKAQARGQFAVKVVDSKQLLLKLVGTTTSFTQRALQDYFCEIMISRIKDCISNLIISENISHAELSSKLVSISESVSPKLAEMFAKYGLSLEEFIVEGINIKEDKAYEAVREAMVDRAADTIRGVSEQEKWQYDVAKTQAQNQGTAGQMQQIFTGMAAGAAVGPAMGNMINNVMQPNNISAVQNQKNQFSMGVVGKKIANQENNNDLICAKCGAMLAPNSRFCSQCATPVEQEEGQLSCPVCGKNLPTGSKFCCYCSTKL